MARPRQTPSAMQEVALFRRGDWLGQVDLSEKFAIQNLLPQGNRVGSQVFLCFFSQSFSKHLLVGNSWLGAHNYRARGIVWRQLWAELCPMQSPYVEIPSTSEYDRFGGRVL